MRGSEPPRLNCRIVLTLIAVAVAGVLGVVALRPSSWFELDGTALQPDLTTNTSSTEFKTSAERVAFLRRYLNLRTQVTDAAFHIVFHDNHRNLPGPSDCSVVAAVKVTPADGPAWLAGARPFVQPPVEVVDDPFADAPPPPRRSLIPPEWHVSSPGTSYTRDRAQLVWHPEGVLEFDAIPN